MSQPRDLRPAVACVLSALVLLLAACSSSAAGSSAGSPDGSTGAVAVSPGATSSVDPTSVPPYLERIPTGGTPCATLGAAGSVWVSDFSGARVSRIDPSTDEVTAVVKTGGSPCGMAFGAHSIWVEDYGAGDLTRILLPSLKTKRYPVGSLPYDVTFAAGAAWVTNYGDDTVSRIDAATGRSTTIDVGSTPIGIAPSAGAVWVGNQGDGTISRIDTSTLRVTSIRAGGSPGWTAYDDRTVWVGDAAKGQVIRVDSRTSKIVARVTIGPTPNDGDVYHGSLWVPDAVDGLYQVDVATNRVSGPYRLGASNPFVADGYDSRLWIADFKGTETFVVDLAKLPRG